MIDERRFAKSEGFANEVVLFAGVRTNITRAFRFAEAVQAARQTLDGQKRSRALKSADVLSGRLAGQLLEPCVELLSWSTVEFWATTTKHLVSVKRERANPAVKVVEGPAAGREINGHETPVLEMISGTVADELRAPQLEVFVDRSKQNGLHEGSHDEFWVWSHLSPASAIREGERITLGANCEIRTWAVSERTKLFGDIVLIADLCAHLWGRVQLAVDRLRKPRLSEGVERIGAAPGLLLVGDLRRAAAT